MNKWIVVYEGTGKTAFLNGTEAWGKVYAIVEKKKHDNLDDAEYLGFVLDKNIVDEIVNNHNKQTND